MSFDPSRLRSELELGLIENPRSVAQVIAELTATIKAKVDLEATSAPLVPKLVTKRILLVSLTRNHAIDLHDVAFRDAETMQFFDFPASANEAETAAQLEFYFKHQMPTWALILNGKAVGLLNYHTYDAGNQRLEIGFLLGRHFWGQGLMAEALRALIRHCFETLAINRIEVDPQSNNTRAITMLRKLGFRAEGIARQRRNKCGKYQDLAVHSLLKSEWKPPQG
jgi:ribosomal-protein-alanine N-acetyltransferase